jgi:hypothetical protein
LIEIMSDDELLRNEAEFLRKALGVGKTPLLLPDPGENAMVVMRYKSIELGFIVKASMVSDDQSYIGALLKTRDLCKQLAEGE